MAIQLPTYPHTLLYIVIMSEVFNREFEKLLLDVDNDSTPQVQDITVISPEEEEAMRVIDEMKPVYRQGQEVPNNNTVNVSNFFFAGDVRDTFLHMSRFVETVEDAICIKNRPQTTPPSVHLDASPPPDISLPFLCLEPQCQEKKDGLMPIDDVIHFMNIES